MISLYVLVLVLWMPCLIMMDILDLHQAFVMGQC